MRLKTLYKQVYIIFQIIGGLLASLEKEKSGKFNYKIFQGYEIGRPSKLEINVSKVNNITKKPSTILIDAIMPKSLGDK